MEKRSNRRQFERSEIQIPVAYRRSGDGLCWTRTFDISAGGVKIRSMEPIPAGTRLELALHIPVTPRERVVASRGTVVWCRPDEGPNPVLICGIMFQRFIPELLNHLIT